MKLRSFLLLMLALIMLAGVACSNTDANDDTQNNDGDTNKNEEAENNDQEEQEAEETDTDEEQNAEDAAAEEENDNDNNQPEQASSSSQELPDPIEIDEQIQHPNGVVFTLEKIKFKEDHIAVDFNAQNGFGLEIYLAADGKSIGSDIGGVTLEDDKGFQYRYVADENDMIQLEEQEKVTGTASFLGELQEDAESLTLIFNPDGSEDDADTDWPRFSFEDIEINR